MLYNDINLIPSPKSEAVPAKTLISMLILVIALSFVSFFFVYVPITEKWAREDRIAELDAQIERFGDLSANYNEAEKVYAEISAESEELKNAYKCSFKTTEALRLFMLYCPEAVDVKTYDLKDEDLVVGCYTKKYDAILESINNLRKIDRFEEVSYMNIDQTDKAGYDFTLTLKVRKQ